MRSLRVVIVIGSLLALGLGACSPGFTDLAELGGSGDTETQDVADTSAADADQVPEPAPAGPPPPSPGVSPRVEPAPVPAQPAPRPSTGVFVNGIELSPGELAQLEAAFGPIAPNSYWLDDQGNYGIEGGPTLGNIYGGGAGGGGPTETYGGWVGDGYYFDGDSGCSVMGGSVSC